MNLVKLATRLDGAIDLEQYIKLRTQLHMVVGTATQPKRQIKTDRERVREVQKGQRHLLPR